MGTPPHPIDWLLFWAIGVATGVLYPLAWRMRRERKEQEKKLVSNPSGKCLICHSDDTTPHPHRVVKYAEFGTRDMSKGFRNSGYRS